jgi:hypothetical protein
VGTVMTAHCESPLRPALARRLAADLAPHQLGAARRRPAAARLSRGLPGFSSPASWAAYRPGTADRRPRRERQEHMALTTSALGMVWLRRPGQGAPALCRSCPDCGRSIRDRDAARLGFCDTCQEFTGMCGAGRKIICPDVLTITSWHSPCTRLGATAWEITLASGRCRALLCDAHDVQLKSGRLPWVKLAVPQRR